MISRGGRCSKMPCESCAVQFSVFKRKQVCCECERYYCSGCLRREGAYVLCAPCKVLSTRPLLRNTITHLKVRDLQCFLQRQNVSTRGCVEKEELVNLCVSHVNSSAFRRKGPRTRPSPFSSLKGFTNNLNVFINNAFEMRNSAQPAPAPPPHSNCFNASHAHAPRPPAPRPPPAQPVEPQVPRERFTTTPGGEPGITVAVPLATRTPSAESAHVDTADCFEIEDLDDAGWEFVTRPADPLPNDSEVLIEESNSPITQPPGERSPPEREAPLPSAGAGSTLAGSAPRSAPHSEVLIEESNSPVIQPPGERSPPEREAPLPSAGGGSTLGGLSPPQRATSELELRPREREAPPEPDSVSLHDEPLPEAVPESEEVVSLERVRSASELEALSVRQLKLLLARNRVCARGCIERADLLQRARTLYRDHAQYRDELDNLPLEECCKICMAAPLECVLLECGHIAACTACARVLAECPICRQYVVRAVRCFRS